MVPMVLDSHTLDRVVLMNSERPRSAKSDHHWDHNYTPKCFAFCKLAIINNKGGYLITHSPNVCVFTLKASCKLTFLQLILSDKRQKMNFLLGTCRKTKVKACGQSGCY